MNYLLCDNQELQINDEDAKQVLATIMVTWTVSKVVCVLWLFVFAVRYQVDLNCSTLYVNIGVFVRRLSFAEIHMSNGGMKINKTLHGGRYGWYIDIGLLRVHSFIENSNSGSVFLPKLLFGQWNWPIPLSNIVHSRIRPFFCCVSTVCVLLLLYHATKSPFSNMIISQLLCSFLLAYF